MNRYLIPQPRLIGLPIYLFGPSVTKVSTILTEIQLLAQL